MYSNRTVYAPLISFLAHVFAFEYNLTLASTELLFKKGVDPFEEFPFVSLYRAISTAPN